MAIERRTKVRQQPVAAPELAPAESEGQEVSLRPRTLADYVGQQRIKEHLQIAVAAARSREEPLGHTLLHGPPGLGKTTLAHIVASEMGAQLRITSGPAIEKPGDLASLLTNLQKGDVLFIDEIHRLRPAIEEVLYGAMEDCVLDIMIGKGPTARSVRLTLQPFTLVAATTKPGSVSAPLRDRFLHNFKVGFYAPGEMQAIVTRTAQLLDTALASGVAEILAGASRATPRIANRLVRSVRDFAHSRGETKISTACVVETLRSLDIDHEGLDATDRLLLRTLVETFGGGPVGLSTLSAILAEDEETLESVYEPYLMQCGYLQRTPKGRSVTAKAYAKLGRDVPKAVADGML
jgi:Holliday junction DNA helicase RuvB